MTRTIIFLFDVVTVIRHSPLQSHTLLLLLPTWEKMWLETASETQKDKEALLMLSLCFFSCLKKYDTDFHNHKKMSHLTKLDKQVRCSSLDTSPEGIVLRAKQRTHVYICQT